MSKNKVNLLGNLGKDPEIYTFDNGDKVAKFTLATSEHWKDKQTGEKKSKTEWHNIVVQGGAAKVVEQYVKKGDKIDLEGKLTTRKWKDNDGNDKYQTEVVCRSVVLLSAKGGNENQNPQNEQNNWDDQDVPF